MKKLLATVLGVGILTAGLCLSAAAEDAAIGIGSVIAKPGEDVDIPIVLSGNPGMEGMELCIEYDKSLTLKGCAVGEALSTLNCTPSGKMDQYPFKFVWDGMADDNSNGTLATLTFTVPADASGSYEISAYVEDGSVYNDDGDDIAVSITGGSITVNSDGAVIGIGSAEAKPGEDVDIPIVLSGNPGMEGMELCIEYDRSLTLKGCAVREALSTLNCTPSHTLDTYPFKFVYDGMADDTSNGTLAILTFTVPSDASGSYAITAYVEDGSVYNDNGDDVAVSITGGSITTPLVKVTSGGAGSESTRTDGTTDRKYTYTVSVPEEVTITPEDITVTIGGVVATKHKGFAEKIGYLTGGDAVFTAAITKIPQAEVAKLSGVECTVTIKYLLDEEIITETTEFTLE